MYELTLYVCPRCQSSYFNEAEAAECNEAHRRRSMQAPESAKALGITAVKTPPHSGPPDADS